MFKKIIENRQNATGIIIIFYLSTVVFLTAVSTSIVPAAKSWNLLSYGLLLSAIGSGATLTILRLWENHLKAIYQEKIAAYTPFKTEIQPIEKPVEDNSSLMETIIQEKEAQLGEIQQNLKETKETLHEREESVRQIRLENDRQKEEIRTLTQQFTEYKEETTNSLNQQAVLCEEYQQTMTDQRTVIKKKQRDIQQLENKIRDLNYEIKTLLELNDSFKKLTPKQEHSIPSVSGEMMLKDTTTYTYQVMDETAILPSVESIEPLEMELIHSSGEATKLLKRCINSAQKITGAHQFSGNMSRLKEMGMENFALDRRRLFDNIRNENSSCVFIFSPKENKALFVNNQIKDLLSWSPDSFVDNFHEIIQEGVQEWKRAVIKLSAESEVDFRLLMKGRNGQDVLVHCLLGSIPTGLFRSHVIGVLYKD